MLMSNDKMKRPSGSIRLYGCILFLCITASLATENITRTPITKPLRIIAVLEPPFIMKDEQTGEYTGFMLEILQKIGVPVAKIYTVDDAPYGMEESPQMWEGVIGELQEDRADMAVAAFGIRAKHAKVLSFSQPVINGGYMVLYKNPKEWTHRKKSIITMVQPFSPGLWCLIVVMCFVASGALYVIRRYSPYETFGHRNDNSPASSWTSGFLFMFSSLVGQSHHVTPTSISGRVLTTVWWVFALMTGGAYIASLVIILFRENPHVHTLPFGTVDEMIKQTEVSVLGIKNSDTYKYMAHHSGYYERKIHEMWKANWDKLMVDGMDAAMELMMKGEGKYGIFMEETAASYLANQEPCDKMVIGEPVGDQAFGFACKRGSTFCDDINGGILNLQETGQIDKLQEKWLWSGCRKGDEYFYEGLPYLDTFGGHGSLLSPLTITITRFSAAFIIMALGIGIAVLVLLVEIIYGRRKRGIPLTTRGSNSDAL